MEAKAFSLIQKPISIILIFIWILNDLYTYGIYGNLFGNENVIRRMADFTDLICLPILFLSFLFYKNTENKKYIPREIILWIILISFTSFATINTSCSDCCSRIGARVNDLNQIKEDAYQDGIDYRALLGADTNALTLFSKRESKTSYRNVYKRESIFIHYYPENSLLQKIYLFILV